METVGTYLKGQPVGQPSHGLLQQTGNRGTYDKKKIWLGWPLNVSL